MDTDISRPELSEKEKKKKKIKKTVFIIIFVILNVIVLFFTAKADFSKQAPDKLPPFTFKNVLYLCGGVACAFSVIMCEAVKFLLMMKHLNEKPSFRAAFETAAIGKYYDSITPSGAGGQPFQIYNMHKHGCSDGASSAMPLGSFVTMQFGFVSLCIFSFIFGDGYIDLTSIKVLAYIGALIYTIGPVFIVFSAVKPSVAVKIVGFLIKIGAKLRIIKDKDAKIQKTKKQPDSYAKNLRMIAKSKLLLFELMFFSLLLQISVCSIPYFVLGAFGADVGFMKSLFMTVYVCASITVVPTPGSSGAAEASFYLLFEGLQTNNLFWAMIVWRLLCYYSFILIGLVIYGVRAVEKLIKRRRQPSSRI